MATPCPCGVLSHNVLEERRHVVMTGILRVTNVLTVVMAGFQRVILNRNEVEADIVETGLPCRHDSSHSLLMSDVSAVTLLRRP